MNRIDYPSIHETAFSGVLPNGLTVRVIPKPGFSRKVAYFVTNYGSMHTRFRRGGKTFQTPMGVAHYLEHKMFDMPGDRDVTAEFAALGASPNAFTSYDMTAYYFSCTDRFEDALRLLLEFVSTPCFTPESVEKEQGIIAQEILMYEDNPDSKVFDALTEAMYRVHPIRENIAGTVESIREITPELLLACHEAFYDPANMILCVVGDVDPERVFSLAEEILPGQRREPAEKLVARECDLSCPRALTRREMDVAMPSFQFGIKCAPCGDGEAGIRRELAADLAAEALFGESSALYLRLYEEGLIDSSFGGGFEDLPGAAFLTCGGDSDDPERVRDEILGEVRRLAREGISQERFDRMKKSALGRKLLDLDNPESICFRVCASFFSQFDYLRFPAVYASLEKREVEAFLGELAAATGHSLSIIDPRTQEEST